MAHPGEAHSYCIVADGELLCREMKNRNSWKCLWVWPSMLPLLSLSGSGHLSGMGSLADLCLAGICPASAKRRRPGKSLPGSDLPGLHPKYRILGLQGQIWTDSRPPRTASRPRQIPARPPTIIGGQANPCRADISPAAKLAGQGWAGPAWPGLAWPGLGWARLVGSPQNGFWP